MDTERPQSCDVLCVGAGPAGLTAAYLLTRSERSVVVLEANPRYVGGIARTEEHNGFRFDVGGHRFYSKSQEIEDLWSEMLTDGFRTTPRRSRIYYRRLFFQYPLRLPEVLGKFGMRESMLCALSYARTWFSRERTHRNLEDWVVSRFGHRLYTMFFKSYTEKVWGRDCRDISADWAGQRIKGFSLGQAVRHFFKPRRSRNGEIKTLIESFRYPKHGPGMLWQAVTDKVVARGGRVELGVRVERLSYDDARALWLVEATDAEGACRSFEARHVVTSAPLSETLRGLSPRPRTADAAASLKYRGLLVVNLILRDGERLSDQWIYVHDPGVRVGRIQNFKAWSADMVPSDDMSAYGLEYFCDEGDELWTAPDSELVALATRELEELGLADAEDAVDHHVIRQAKAYPVYDQGYEERLAEIKAELRARYPGLHLVGRNGLHKYNNQDHSMMTAVLVSRNILAGRRIFDEWNVNQDAEYLEEKSDRVSGADRSQRIPVS